MGQLTSKSKHKGRKSSTHKSKVANVRRIQMKDIGNAFEIKRPGT